MARHEYSFYNPQTLRDDDLAALDDQPLMALVDAALRLRQLNSDGEWDPRGTFTTASVLLHTWTPNSLRELTGFCSFGTEVGTSRILFRLSTDDDPQLFWDSTTLAWRAPVDDTEWNTELEIDAGIGTFPVQCAIKFHLNLESVDGTSTPLFEGLYVFWETNYDANVDLIESIFDKLQTEVDIEGEWCMFYEDPVSTILLDDRLFDIADPVQVFDLDADPCKRDNLLASRTGGQLELTKNVTGQIFVSYRGRLTQIHIASDSDFAREQLPAVVIRNITNPRVRDIHLHEIPEPLRSRGIVRLRTMPARHTMTYRLVCTGFDDLTSKRISDGVRRSFDTREFVRSKALDEDMPLVDLENTLQVNIVEQQLWERTVEMAVSVLEWMPSYRDVPMASEITHRMRTFCPNDISSPE